MQMTWMLSRAWLCVHAAPRFAIIRVSWPALLSLVVQQLPQTSEVLIDHHLIMNACSLMTSSFCLGQMHVVVVKGTNIRDDSLCSDPE